MKWSIGIKVSLWDKSSAILTLGFFLFKIRNKILLKSVFKEVKKKRSSHQFWDYSSETQTLVHSEINFSFATANLPITQDIVWIKLL